MTTAITGIVRWARRAARAPWRGLVKRRVRFGIALLVLMSGVAVRLFTSGPFAEHAGTALYGAFIYTLVAAFGLRLRPVTVFGVAVVLCWLVEFFQLTGVPAQMAAHSSLSRWALGTTFHPADLPWYVIAATAAVCLHWTPLPAKHTPDAQVDTAGAGAKPLTPHSGDAR